MEQTAGVAVVAEEAAGARVQPHRSSGYAESAVSMESAVSEGLHVYGAAEEVRKGSLL